MIQMKKTILSLLLICAIMASTNAQMFTLTGYGGYTFQDHVSFANAYGYLNESGHWGVSVEGMNHSGRAVELLYQQQSTHIPVYAYSGVGGQLNKNDDKAIVSYVMLNAVNYLKASPKAWPYFGVGLGVGIVSPSAGNSESAFAWDAKLGVKIRASTSVSLKIQEQLFSMVQASGAGFYAGTGGAGVAVTSYSSIYQFGFSGGLCFDLDKSKR
jgi:hypothetical protein